MQKKVNWGCQIHTKKRVLGMRESPKLIIFFSDDGLLFLRGKLCSLIGH